MEIYPKLPEVVVPLQDIKPPPIGLASLGMIVQTLQEPVVDRVDIKKQTLQLLWALANDQLLFEPGKTVDYYMNKFINLPGSLSFREVQSHFRDQGKLVNGWDKVTDMIRLNLTKWYTQQ